MAVSPMTLVKAEAFRTWIKSLIGEKPELVVYQDYAEIKWTDEQRAKLMALLDDRVKRLFRPSDQAAPELQIRFGKVLVPWSVRYIVPAALGVFALGAMTNAAARKR